jgi:hypothetical protein
MFSEAPSQNASVPLLASGMGIIHADDLEGSYWVATHLAAVVFMAMVVLLSCLLLVQYLVRYHKYQRTAGTEPISPCHSLGGSIGRCVSHNFTLTIKLISICMQFI